MSSCLLTHNIFPHTSLHDQPCHKTMKKYEDFEGMIISLLHTRKFAIRTWFCNCPQYLCLFGIVVECRIQERCWFSARGPKTKRKDKTIHTTTWMTHHQTPRRNTTQHGTSWRSATDAILLGHREHTGGSQQDTTVHPC